MDSPRNESNGDVVRVDEDHWTLSDFFCGMAFNDEDGLYTSSREKYGTSYGVFFNVHDDMSENDDSTFKDFVDSVAQPLLGSQSEKAKPISARAAHKLKKTIKDQSKARLQDYLPFVPRRVIPQLGTLRNSVDAQCEPLTGVVSFLDLAGFTKLTERLALQTDGAERLARIINKLLTQLLDTLQHGDVIKFSGDAILVLYEPKVEEESPNSVGNAMHAGEIDEENHEKAMRRAAYHAVSEGLRALRDTYWISPEELGPIFNAEDDSGTNGITLKLHVAICSGEMQMMHVGGIFGRWEILLAGPAMQALSATADLAATDTLVVEENTWALLQPDKDAAPTSPDSWMHFKGHSMPAPSEAFVLIEDEIDESGSRLSSRQRSSTMLGSLVDSIFSANSVHPHRRSVLELTENVSMDDLFALRRYVSPVIQSAIQHQTLNMVSSFTDVTVFFVGISGLNLADFHKDTGKLWGQVVMETCQECVYDYEGSINKFVMDDKGALLLCAWGLPPMSHTDDPFRACASALHLNSRLKELGVSAHIGVTSGKAFAGVIGPQHRCEFSLLGDMINLSARFMGKAPMGGVLVDDKTYNSALKSGMHFEILEPIKVKGKELPQAIFRPLGDTVSESELRDGSMNVRLSQVSRGDNLGSSGATILSQGLMRAQEREQIFDILETLFLHEGGTMVLTGEAGSGKSELAKEIQRSAELFNARLIVSQSKKSARHSTAKEGLCGELSQVLRGLLEVVLANSDDGPVTEHEWVELVVNLLPDDVKSELGPRVGNLYGAYFQEWIESDPIAAAAAAAKEAEEGSFSVSRNIKTRTSSIANTLTAEQEEEAQDRLRILLAVVQKIVDSTRHLMIYVHLRTGSSLSMDATHPETWPMVVALSNLSVQRLSDANESFLDGVLGAKQHNSLVVALTHRRVLDAGGPSVHESYRKVMANAEACNALLQLDPLSEEARYMYLCLAMKADEVPVEVATYVSRVANGNPQHIEITAEAIAIHNPPIVKERKDGKRMILELTDHGPQLLDSFEPPPKITGTIRQTLGTLGAKELLVVKVLSQFDELDRNVVEDEDQQQQATVAQNGSSKKRMNRFPSMGPIGKVAAAAAISVAQRRERARQRANRGNTQPPTLSNIMRAYASITPLKMLELREVVARLVFYGIVIEVPISRKDPQFMLEHSLMKDIASGMLLDDQRQKILSAITKKRTGSTKNLSPDGSQPRTSSV